MKIKWKKIIQFKWFKRLYILYIFGFVLNFRPSLPFFYEFLRSNQNFSKDEVLGDILPMWFYSTSVLLIPVFLFMDFLKYYPIIIISTITGLVATCLYIWTDSLVELEVAQAFYGCMTAAEVAYYVSIYAHGDEKNYQRLTSWVRAAPLAAKMIASFVAQLFISLEWLTFKELHYFNFATFIIAAILTIFLPPSPVEDQEIEKSEKLDKDPSKFSSICWNLTRSFPNKYVVKWSLWSILTICGYNQIIFYVQPLWQHVQTIKETFVYNGVLEGLYTLFALIGTILGAWATFDWKFKGDLILSMTSLVIAFMLLFMAQITIVWLNSMCYIFLGFIYHFSMTVLCGEIAKFLKKGCFGLVFGFISMIGWALSSGMVCLIHEQAGFEMDDSKNVFMIYGFYHLGISVLFIVIGLSYWFAKHTYQ